MIIIMIMKNMIITKMMMVDHDHIGDENVDYFGPSWSLDASETGEGTKCPWVEAVGLTASR